MPSNPNMRSASAASNLRHSVTLAVVLSLGAAISLGVTRFSYGLLLPPMRADLGWSYTLAGAMNTINALGYLLGALSMPRLLKRHGAAQMLVVGAVLASVFMMLTGFFTTATPLLLQRLLAGVASAWVFVAGGLLAAQLGVREPDRSGLLLGVYYGGTGLGIVLSALLVPGVAHVVSVNLPAAAHPWVWAWWALAVACGVGTLVLMTQARAMRALTGPAATSAESAATSPVSPGTSVKEPLQTPFRWRSFTFALLGYGCFGVGYIGYMTFVIALLREHAASTTMITVFYTLLGLAVMASSRIWAKLLDRYRGGQALALLNTLLGCAIVVPALTSWQPALILSGLLFGGVFLSVVASTTALVRHNLPASAWGAGISAFTIVFAAGQIVGPTMVGWIADGTGGLARGLLISALALWVGAALAWRQKPLQVRV